MRYHEMVLAWWCVMSYDISSISDSKGFFLTAVQPLMPCCGTIPCRGMEAKPVKAPGWPIPKPWRAPGWRIDTCRATSPGFHQTFELFDADEIWWVSIIFNYINSECIILIHSCDILYHVALISSCCCLVLYVIFSKVVVKFFPGQVINRQNYFMQNDPQRGIPTCSRAWQYMTVLLDLICSTFSAQNSTEVRNLILNPAWSPAKQLFLPPENGCHWRMLHCYAS